MCLLGGRAYLEAVLRTRTRPYRCSAEKKQKIQYLIHFQYPDAGSSDLRPLKLCSRRQLCHVSFPIPPNTRTIIAGNQAQNTATF